MFSISQLKSSIAAALAQRLTLDIVDQATDPMLLAPRWLGQHTATMDRRRERKACKLMGHRQYRRATRHAYKLRNISPIIGV
jgi:hypothetical protein